MVDTWKPILDELMVVDELEAVISSSWTQFLTLMFWGWKKRKIDISKLSAFQVHCNGLCSPRQILLYMHNFHNLSRGLAKSLCSFIM